MINRDFSDIRTIMSGMGYAMMGTAICDGPDAAVEAARAAINSPLMEEGGILGARGVLINITASSKLGIHELNEACKLIGESTRNNDVQINFGVVLDETLGEKVKITVIATGFQRDTVPEVDRRNPHFPFTVTSAPDAAAQNGSAHEPSPEPAGAAPAFDSEPEPAHAPAHQEEAPSLPDYELPAYLRKQRRMVQQKPDGVGWRVSNRPPASANPAFANRPP